MLNIIRIGSLFLLVLLSACTTTSSSFTTPYATKETTSTGSSYDLEKAAATRLTLGLRYLAQGDFEKAKFNLDKALAHYPKSEEVQRGVAWYYEKVNEDKLAEEHYKKALSINNKNPSLLNQYGVFLCRKGELNERTRAYLSRYEEVAKHNSRSLWLAIRNASKLRDLDAAASYAIKLEQLFPDSKETELFLDTKNQWLR